MWCHVFELTSYRHCMLCLMFHRLILWIYRRSEYWYHLQSWVSWFWFLMLHTFQLNLHWRIERELMRWEISAIYQHLFIASRWFIHWTSMMILCLSESYEFSWLCSSIFFFFSEYAEVWCARHNWMLQQYLN